MATYTTIQGRWANVQAIDVKFSRDVTRQISLKSVNFLESYLKNKKMDVFGGTQCIHNETKACLGSFFIRPHGSGTFPDDRSTCVHLNNTPSQLPLSHWVHFTVLRCICVFVFSCISLHACCIIVTRWGGPGGIEA